MDPSPKPQTQPQSRRRRRRRRPKSASAEPVAAAPEGEARLSGAEASTSASSKPEWWGRTPAEQGDAKVGRAGAGGDGEAFVRAYYACLGASRLDALVDFYDDDAVLTLQHEDDGDARDGDSGAADLTPLSREIRRKPVVEGKVAIGERLERIFRHRDVALSRVDSQLSSNGTTFVVAAGTLLDCAPGGPSTPAAGFVHSFIVDMAGPGPPRILNDIFSRAELPPAPAPGLGAPPLALPSGLSAATPQASTPAAMASEARDAHTPAATPLPRRNVASAAVPRRRDGLAAAFRPRTGPPRAAASPLSPLALLVTPRKLFRPVSLAQAFVAAHSQAEEREAAEDAMREAAGDGEAGKDGEGRGGGRHIAALMAFVASLCEGIVNAVWGAVAALHVAGTLALLVSVGVMAAKSARDLGDLEQRAGRVEAHLQAPPPPPAPASPLLQASAAVAGGLREDAARGGRGWEEGVGHSPGAQPHGAAWGVLNLRPRGGGEPGHRQGLAAWLAGEASLDLDLGGSSLLASLQRGEMPVGLRVTNPPAEGQGTTDE